MRDNDMKRGLWRLAIVAHVMIVSIAPASADCWLYEHQAFQGHQVQIKAYEVLAQLGAMDNKASSIRVERGCILIAFDQPDLKGPPRTWGTGNYARLPSGWNDVISSARCNCRIAKPAR